MRWRRRLITLHRDIGYIAVGLTVVYAVSGIAVNHAHHWNYSFNIEHRSQRVGSPAELLGVSAPRQAPGVLARQRPDELIQALVKVTNRERPPHNAFWRGPDRLSLFYGKGARDVVDYIPSTGVVEHWVREPRPFFRQVNFLHLNESPAVWTWVGDIYAVALLFLSLSGIFLVKGRYGLRGRGGVLLALGIIIPVVAIILLN